MAARTRNPSRTTLALLEAARAEFVAKGFAEAKTEAIVARAGLTRGALYHHFADKTALFACVVESMMTEIDLAVSIAASKETSPFGALRSGIRGYLRECARDDVRRVLLIDGPAVLGWEQWRAIDERSAFAATRDSVRRCMRAGEIATTDANALARTLLGMVTQAGLEIGRSENPKQTHRSLSNSIDFVLDALKTDGLATRPLAKEAKG